MFTFEGCWMLFKKKRRKGKKKQKKETKEALEGTKESKSRHFAIMNEKMGLDKIIWILKPLGKKGNRERH